MRKLDRHVLLALLVMAGCVRTPLANQPSPLKIETRRFERTLPGCGDSEKREQPCFSFQVVYPEVTAAPDEEIRTRLNAQVKALLQPAGAPAGFEEEAAQLSERYSSREQHPEEEPAWFVRRTAETIHSTAAAWAVRIERTEYLGGAGANTTYDCLNLNPATGLDIQLTDLVAPGNMEKLRAAAEARFRAERKIPAGQRLSEAGFVFAGDQFTLPPRFLIGKQGLVFIYAPHEITPEAQGPTYLILPWAGIEALIDRESGVVPAAE